MRMWSQSKISSCFIYDWCKSRVVGGRESQRLPTQMVESFFADLLPAIKSDWRVGYKIVAYNAISVGLGRQKRLFCECAAETIIIVIINIIVYIYIYILLWWWWLFAFYHFCPFLLHKVMYRSTCK